MEVCYTIITAEGQTKGHGKPSQPAEPPLAERAGTSEVFTAERGGAGGSTPPLARETRKDFPLREPWVESHRRPLPRARCRRVGQAARKHGENLFYFFSKKDLTNAAGYDTLYS